MVAFGNAHHNALVIGWGHFALGSVAYEWNDLSTAREHFEAVLALGRSAQRMCSVNATLGLAQTLIAQGQPAEAERLMLAELEQVEGTHDTFFLEGLRSFLARLALESSNLDRATYWLAGVAPTRKSIAGYDSENPLLTRAHVLVARASPDALDEASVAVACAVEAAEARHVVGYIVKGLAVRALIERSRGDNGRAARSIARALEIAEPGRFTRAFVDLGPPLTSLLADLASRGGLPKGGARVLDVCRAESGARVFSLSGRDQATPKPVETVTWRELDVLQLMDGHLTNKEIARRLGIGEETVKKHAASIYSKLEAKGRREAVARAYDLGILRAETRRAPRSG